MSGMKDELSVSPEEMASVLGSAPSAQEPEYSEAEPMAAQADAEVDSDDPKGFFNDQEEQSVNPAQVSSDSSKFKFKFGDKEVELSSAEVQDRLSKYESGKSSPQVEAKFKREKAALEAKVAEMSKFQENWEKLEALKQDKRQLLETITGENFDEMIAREADRAEIKKYGTDEQKRALAAEERAERAERDRDSERDTRQKEQDKLDARAREVEMQRINTAMEREYFKHELPPGLSEYDQEVLKDALWVGAQRTLDKYRKEYGTITNKMVEKAFADRANALYRTTSKQVEQKIKTVRDQEKKEAKENAQLASTRQSDPWESKDVSKLTPRKLFDLIRNKR